MIKKLLPLVLILIGLGAGVGAGIALRPDPTAKTDEAHGDPGCGDLDMASTPSAELPPISALPENTALSEFIKIPEQFVIPVVDGDSVAALVVMSLTLEVEPNAEDQVFSRLPKLRDGFLRVMLDHANTGGFDGTFTSNGSMETLRRGFVDVAQGTFPKGVRDVLILNINRQDL